jgi:hypothetical protein
MQFLKFQLDYLEHKKGKKIYNLSVENSIKLELKNVYLSGATRKAMNRVEEGFIFRKNGNR